MSKFTDTEMRQINMKFMRGNLISNAELDGLIELHSRVLADLIVLGIDFGIAKREVYNRLNKLKEYRDAREAG